VRLAWEDGNWSGIRESVKGNGGAATDARAVDTYRRSLLFVSSRVRPSRSAARCGTAGCSVSPGFRIVSARDEGELRRRETKN
jgi:hypothetical protein